MGDPETAVAAAEVSEEGGRKGSTAKPINVLLKAFDVLEVMADLPGPAPLRDIATATGLPKGTLFRVLQTLLGRGYVAQISDGGAYYLTSRLCFLGRNANLEEIKVLAARPMQDLLASFNETINLGVLDAPFVDYIDVLVARRALSWSVPAGARDMFYSTALGRAIAAFLPEEDRTALVGQTSLTSRTANTVMSRAALTSILEEVRATGIALDREENDDGVVCIGAPLFLEGAVVASISVSVPASRFSPALGEAIGDKLRALDLRFGRRLAD